MIRRISMCCLALSLTWMPTQADPPRSEKAVDMSEVIQMAAGGKAPDKSSSEFPEFEDVTKDMKSNKGLFTLWYYPPDAKDKDSEKLLCQIPSGFLGEKFMLSTSFSGGGFFTGFPLD